MDLEVELDILRYLIEQISYIEKYTAGCDEHLFLRSDVIKDAVLTRLMVLGEYSGRVDKELKDRFSDVEWQLLKAARNYYAHAYNGVDWLMVWEVIELILPGLKIKFAKIIDTLESNLN